MDIKEINKRIKSIKGRGKTIDRDIDIAGCAIMEHAAEHGDYSAANRLVDALPKSARTKAFITWFADHTPYNWTDKEKCFKLPKDASKRRQFMIDEAKAVPFWEYTVEVTPVAIDVDKLCQFDNILDQANKRLEKAEETKGDKTAFEKRAALFNKLSDMSVEDIMVKLNA